MTRKVSVIIPAYNCARFLPKAIESSLLQKHSVVEIVVVNDGSTDGTDEAVRPYLDRIRYIKQENKGLSAARNAGFRASTGKFICFLDADDLLLPDKFDRQLAMFREEPDLGVVISGYLDVEADGKTVINSVCKPWNRDGLKRLLNHEVFPPHAALVRREVLEKSSLFPENIDTVESQEDWQLWLDLALDGVQFGSVVEPTCLYRRNVNGSISSNLLKHNDGARRVVQWLRNDPRAQKYAKQVDRLEAIVQMERVGRAWRIGEKSLAVETLDGAVATNPPFWSEPGTFRRLAEFMGISCKSGSGSRADMNNMECGLMNGLLEAARAKLEPSLLSQLRATAFLMLADIAYGFGDGNSARNYARRALHESKLPLHTPSHYPVLARSAVGPKWGKLVGDTIRLTSKSKA